MIKKITLVLASIILFSVAGFFSYACGVWQIFFNIFCMGAYFLAFGGVMIFAFLFRGKGKRRNFVLIGISIGIIILTLIYYIPAIYCYFEDGLYKQTRCIPRYSDGGMECHDSSECEGICFTSESVGSEVVGACEGYYGQIQSYNKVENGKAICPGIIIPNPL